MWIFSDRANFYWYWAAAIGILSQAQERCADAARRVGRPDFAIRRARGVAKLALRARGDSGFRARSCRFYRWQVVSVVHTDRRGVRAGREALALARSGLLPRLI